MDLDYTSDSADAPLAFANGLHSLTLDNATDAAETVAARRPKLLKRYLALLTEQGPQTDHEAAALLGVPNTSLCSTRSALKGRVMATGAKLGPWGTVNTVFALATANREVEAA